MNNTINTILEIEQEQERLKRAMDITKKEFSKSIQIDKSTIFKKILLPTGLAGAGAYVIKNTLSIADNKADKMSRVKAVSTSETNEQNPLLMSLLPIGIKLLQEYFVKKLDNEN